MTLARYLYFQVCENLGEGKIKYFDIKQTLHLGCDILTHIGRYRRMTDSEKIDLILSKLNNTDERFDALENKIQGTKTDMQGIKTDMQGIKADMQDIKQRVKSVELHLENTTDKNIQLIAENFIELTNKLNQAIPVADKNLAYEVKVNYLVLEMDKLKKEIAELKNKIA